MLSILIPIYNFDVRSFVNKLHKQAIDENILFEILLVDDASENTFRKINKSLNELKFVNYFQLEKNIGRSKIRNLLAEKAKYEYLLFADCDTDVFSANFIKNYIQNIEKQSVICGGITYSKEKPENSDLFFRWYYGNNREKSSAEKRNKKPYDSFMSGNFLIPKTVFEKIKFDEKISEYGHEDTLFGIELQRKEIDIKHIYNPLIHIGLEGSKTFILKTKKGIDNLIYLVKNYKYPELFENIKLLKTYKKTKNLSFLFRLFFIFFHQAIEKNLCGTKPRLKLFDLYKLSYLHSIIKTQK